MILHFRHDRNSPSTRLHPSVIMASFFNSFRSSNMPKRLLRYALSRLELLDTDALDIDKLDFALGKNTVFTFQDVGIKLQACLTIPSIYWLSF